MAQTYVNSKKIPVYYRMGTFENSNEPRFVKAPFDVIQINGIRYLQPISFSFSTAGIAQTSSSDAEQAILSRQDGYFTDLNPIVVGENEMGNRTNSWTGMHSFGWV